EGPRIPACVSRWTGGGHPAAPRGRRRRQCRGGAAADVRRADARRAQPALVVLPHTQACRRESRLRTVTVPRRARAGRRALRGSAAVGGRGDQGQGRRQFAAPGAEGDGGEDLTGVGGATPVSEV